MVISMTAVFCIYLLRPVTEIIKIFRLIFEFNFSKKKWCWCFQSSLWSSSDISTALWLIMTHQLYCKWQWAIYCTTMMGHTTLWINETWKHHHSWWDNKNVFLMKYLVGQWYRLQTFHSETVSFGSYDDFAAD